MKRLTTHDELDRPLVIHANREFWDNIYSRLMEYEDTDLSPQEFTESADFVLELNKKLKPFIDADANSRLIILPCSIGDIVYLLKERINAFGEAGIQEKRVIGFKVEKDGIWVVMDDYDSWIAYRNDSESIFYSREEAEKALNMK